MNTRIKHQRLSQEEKDNLRKLTKEGNSLNKIVQLTGLGKTTVYYNVKDLKSRLAKEFIINLPEEKIGELLGAFAGDGSYSYSYKKDKNWGGHHRIRYSLCISRDMPYAKYLRDLLRQLNLNPFLCKKEKTNAMDLSVNSIAYINFIKEFLKWDSNRSHSIRLKKEIDEYSEEFLRGFVRGLMDTDGYVEVSNVSCASTSERLMKNLSQIFDKFELKYKFSIKIKNPPCKDLFLIRVYRGSLGDYLRLFGFSNNYKLEKLNKILNKNGATQI